MVKSIVIIRYCIQTYPFVGKKKNHVTENITVYIYVSASDWWSNFNSLTKALWNEAISWELSCLWGSPSGRVFCGLGSSVLVQACGDCQVTKGADRIIWVLTFMLLSLTKNEINLMFESTALKSIQQDIIKSSILLSF